MNEFERLTQEVVLIDGKHYQAMTDEEVANFIWGTEEENLNKKPEPTLDPETIN